MALNYNYGDQIPNVIEKLAISLYDKKNMRQHTLQRQI